jgi:hypothetical protein
MSQSKDKKLRKLYRKDVRRLANEQSQIINEKIQEFTSELDRILKPNPWFIPEFLWISLQKVFLNV